MENNFFKDLALSYRKKYEKSPTESSLQEIVFELKNKRDYLGILLSYDDKVKILQYILEDSSDGVTYLNESDNSALTDLVKALSIYFKEDI